MDPDVQIIASHLLYQLSRGVGGLEAQDRVDRLLPFRPTDEQWDQAFAAAYAAQGFAEAIAGASGPERLRDLYPGTRPNFGTVAIRVLYDLPYGGRGRKGNSRSVVIDVPWNTSVETVMALAVEQADQSYHGRFGAPVNFRVVPNLPVPPQQRQ